MFFLFCAEGVTKILDDRGFSEFEDVMHELETDKVVITDRPPTMNKGKCVLSTDESHHSRANTLFRNSSECFHGRKVLNFVRTFLRGI